MLDVYSGDARGDEINYGAYGNPPFGDPYFSELQLPEIKELTQRIAAGGYPAALARSSSRRRTAWYRNYIETLVQRDVRDLARIRALDAVPRLLALAAGHEDPPIPNYGDKGEGPVIREGMVLALEPMVTEGDWNIVDSEDGFTYKTADGKLAAHFEHTIAVTKDGPVVLTK